jgi:hypothetical protein
MIDRRDDKIEGVQYRVRFENSAVSEDEWLSEDDLVI